MRLIGLGGSYVPGGDASVMMQRPFTGNLLTSDPVRYARNVAVLEAEPMLATAWPTVGWTDAAFKVMREFAKPGLPCENPPADAGGRRRPGPDRLDARRSTNSRSGCGPARI